MHIHKTKKNGIGIDFIENYKKPTIIYCQGFPCTPTKKQEISEIWGNGFSVIVPKYFGSWESSGTLGITNSKKTIEIVLGLLQKNAKLECAFCGKKIGFSKKETILLGDSYGTLIARMFPHKKILFSPLTWNNKTKSELKQLKRVFKKGTFGRCYKLSQKFFAELENEIKTQTPNKNELCFFDRGNKHGYSELKKQWLKKVQLQ